MLAFQIFFLLAVTAIGVLITSPLAFWGVSRIKKKKFVLGGMLCLPTLFFASLPVLWLGAIGWGVVWYSFPSHVFTSVFGREELKNIREIKTRYSFFGDSGVIEMTFMGDRKTFERLVRMRAPEGGAREVYPVPNEIRSDNTPAWLKISGATEKVTLPGRKEFASETEEMYWLPDGLIVYKYEGVD